MARSREHAAIVLQELHLEYADPLPIITERWTVREMLDTWLGNIARSVARATHANYETTIRKYIAPYLGKHYAGSLTAAHADDWLASLHEQETGSRTIQNAYAILHACFEDCRQKRLLKDNPLQFVERPRHEREQIQPFTQGEMTAIIESSRTQRLGAMIEFAFLTGLRVGELLGLMWSDWDESTGRLQIQRQACGRNNAWSPDRTEASRPAGRAGSL